jgi:hypothetical protein
VVCPKSITEWHSSRDSSKKRPNSDRYFQQKNKKRFIDIRGTQIRDVTVQFCPTPTPFDQASDVSSEALSFVSTDTTRLLKNLPETSNYNEAMKSIRKIVCVRLNHKYLKNGYFKENEVIFLFNQ